MFTFENSIFIKRPKQEVFDFVNNPANDSQWRTGTIISEWTSEGPTHTGSTQHSVAKFLGREIESTIEITLWDPPNQAGVKAVGGPVPFEVSLVFEAKDNGTQLTQTGHAEIGGFFKLAEGLVGNQLKKQFENDSNTLKRLLETTA